MYLIGDVDGKIAPVPTNDDKTADHHVMTFSPVERDYKLTAFMTWHEYQVVYRLKIGDSYYSLPQGIYVLCGDDTGDFDWVMIDELLNRNITVITSNLSLNKWDTHNVSFELFTSTVILPKSKNPFPVLDNKGQQAILISYVDRHKDMKNVDINEIFF